MAVFVLDSGVWIHINRNHPPDIFVNLWQLLDDGIENGEIRSPQEVCEELQDGTDDLAQRLREGEGLFVPLTEELQHAVAEVLVECPTLVDPESDRNRADPFVVALARLLDATAVSTERRRRSATARMKIPDACDHLGVPHADWFEFLRLQRWRL